MTSTRNRSDDYHNGWADGFGFGLLVGLGAVVVAVVATVLVLSL